MTLAAENSETRTAAARSWLLAAAVGEDALSAAARAGADCLVVDLEDGVPFARKSFARQLVREWLSDNPSWVRIGDVNSGQHALDVEVVRGTPGVLVVVLAKAESAEDVRTRHANCRAPDRADDRVRARTHPRGRDRRRRTCGPPGLRCRRLPTRHRRGEHPPPRLTYARSRLVVASRAAGLPGPIDGPSAREERWRSTPAVQPNWG